MRPLSWLLVATHVPADGAGGGMVRYAVELARALAERDDVDLHLLVETGAADFFESIAAVRGHVHTVPAMPTVVRSGLELLGAGVPVRVGFDVVQGTKHLLPRSRGSRRALTVHDMLPLDRPRDFGLLKRSLLPRPYLASARAADVLLCVSAATQDRLLSYVPSARARSHVVPLAISTALLHVIPRAVPGLAPPFVLAVGDDSGRKNVRSVVERWASVAASTPSGTLVLVGPQAWRRGPVSALMSRLEASGRVRRLGHVPDDQLRWCYEHAAAVVCPSLLEGFGLPTVEAAQLGSPVITSDDPALCEASGAAAQHLTSRDAAGWEVALREALARRPGRRPVTGPGRTWADVAAETVEAVRRAS